MQTTIQMRRPHSDKQRQMIVYPGNVVAFAGRRFGKTDAFVQRIFYHMQRRPGLYWWVGLSWRSASMKRAFRIVSYYARRILRSLGISDRGYINRSTNEIRIPQLGEIWFRTADNPESMAGEGIRGAVLDEFSLMQEIVWTEYVQATLLDYGGWAAFGGVPKGNNWASNLWRAAAERDGWCQIHATSYDNPFMSGVRLDKIRAEATEAVFRQEYLAEILSGEGMVFRRITEAATAAPQDGAIGGHTYTVGVDWARDNDYTCLAVYDATLGAIVALDRFNQIDYQIQLGRLAALHDRFRPSAIIAEANSIGQPLIEQLQRQGLPVVPFTTTNASKQIMVDALALAFENRSLTIIPDPVLIAELQAYQGERLPGGAMRYSAPQGLHDDTVMAVMLAYQNPQPAVAGVSSYAQRNFSTPQRPRR